MNKSQKALIRERFFSLASSTTISMDFLSKFKSHRVFSVSDIYSITTLRDDTMPIDQAFQFYKRLVSTSSTSEVFELLLSALKDTNQMVPYGILSGDISPDEYSEKELLSMTNDSSELFKDSKNFLCPPDLVKTFVLSSDGKVLHLECQNPHVTLARIMDTLKVELVDPEKIGQRKTEAPYVLLINGTVEQAVVKSLTKRSKLIILHPLGQVPQDETDARVILTGKDSIEWEHLHPSFQTELMSKLQKSCRLDLTPSEEILRGRMLVRLIQDASEENHLLFGKILKDYLTEKVGKFDFEPALLEDLGRIAVKELFPQWEPVIFGQNSTYEDQSGLTRLVSAKLLKQTFYLSFEYEFEHPWMSHYFLGKFLAKNGTDLDMFMRIILGLIETPLRDGHEPFQGFEFENKMATYFLDFHANANAQLDFEDWGDLTHTVSACVNGNLANLLEIVLPHLNMTDVTLVKRTVFKASTGISDMLLQRFAELSKLVTPSSAGDTLLHGAVQRGKLDLTSKLLFDYSFKQELGQKHMRNLIHACVENTLHQSEAEVADKIEILRLLVNLESSLLKEKFGTLEAPPLLCPKIHLSLIKALLEHGVDATYVNDKDHGRNLAYVIAIGRSPWQYHEVLSYFISIGMDKLFKVKDARNMSPLHFAVAHTDLLEETIELCKANDIGLNGLCKKEQTILFYAVDGGRSMSFIRSLVDHGVNWRRTNVKGESVLLRAVFKGNLEAIKYFVNLGLDVNGRDKIGCTGLHKCFIHNGMENQVEVVQTLIDLGHCVNPKDSSGHTPLWWALKGPSKERNRLEAVLLLKRMGGRK